MLGIASSLSGAATEAKIVRALALFAAIAATPSANRYATNRLMKKANIFFNYLDKGTISDNDHD